MPIKRDHLIRLCIVAFTLGANLAADETASQAIERPSGTERNAIEPDTLPNLGVESTLSDFLLYAALSNAELEAAFNRWRAALERIPQAEALPDPRLSYRYFVREVETRVGPQRQAFELSQQFPWFGKLELAGDAAGQVAMAERQRYEATKLRVFYAVKSAWYEYYYLTRSVAVTEENAELLRNVEAVARQQYAAGRTTRRDVIRLQVELGSLDDRAEALRDLKGPMAAELNAALNRPLDAAVPAIEDIEPEFITIDENAAADALNRLNPTLQAIAYEAASAHREMELARKKYAPDITLGLNYTDVGSSDRAARFGDNGKDAVAAMISISIPIWHGSYSAAVSEARLQRLSKLQQRRDTANKLKAELQMSLYRLRDGRRKIDLYDNALLPKARESLKVTEQAFRAGDASFVDLIDAQRTYLDFELSNERALADHQKALAKIEMLCARRFQD